MNVEFDRHGAVAQAVAFAAYAQDGRVREGTALPCIVHSMETAAIAATMTNDPDVLCAAVLHDVAEDCGVTEAELRSRFGRRVAQMVLYMSEPPRSDPRGSWQRCKLRTVNRLRVAGREQMILALADRLSSLRAVDRARREQGPMVWRRLGQANPSMHRWYYASVAEALKPIAHFEAYREYLALIDQVFEDVRLPAPPEPDQFETGGISHAVYQDAGHRQ